MKSTLEKYINWDYVCYIEWVDISKTHTNHGAKNKFGLESYS